MKFLMCLCAVAVAGCAGGFSKEQVAQTDSLVRQGRCAEAYQAISEISGPLKLYNSAYIARVCENNLPKAVNFLNYAARNGHQESIDELLRLGQNVPYADLAVQRKADAAAGMAQGMALIQAGAARPPAAIGGNGMIKFLKNSYQSGTSTMCQYDDGSVQNIGIGICPLSKY